MVEHQVVALVVARPIRVSHPIAKKSGQKPGFLFTGGLTIASKKRRIKELIEY